MSSFNTCTTRCICKSFKELLSILLRVATAKVRTFSFIFQIFPEVFSFFFLLTASLSIADAKVGGFYLLTKCFCDYFLKYFSVFCFLLVSNDLVVGVFLTRVSVTFGLTQK